MSQPGARSPSGVLVPDDVNTHLSDMEQLALAAAEAAEQANQIASVFTRLRNYVNKKKLFRRNGLTVRLGTMDVQLSLYVCTARTGGRIAPTSRTRAVRPLPPFCFFSFSFFVSLAL